MSERKSQAQRLLDLFVFAPAGLAQNASEEFEKLAEKGRHRVEGQIHTARLVGQFAVQTARVQAQRMFESAVARVAGADEGDDEHPHFTAESSLAGEEGAPEEGQPSGSLQGPVSSRSSNGSSAGPELAIPGYDSLSASQVVQRLGGLSRDELEEVKEHEAAHRHRRTILNRVEQLLSGAESEQL